MRVGPQLWQLQLLEGSPPRRGPEPLRPHACLAEGGAQIRRHKAGPQHRSQDGRSALHRQPQAELRGDRSLCPQSFHKHQSPVDSLLSHNLLRTRDVPGIVRGEPSWGLCWGLRVSIPGTQPTPGLITTGRVWGPGAHRERDLS